jgi:hypothetical protein
MASLARTMALEVPFAGGFSRVRRRGPAIAMLSIGKGVRQGRDLTAGGVLLRRPIARFATTVPALAARASSPRGIAGLQRARRRNLCQRNCGDRCGLSNKLPSHDPPQ